jgi:hypothetical protein
MSYFHDLMHQVGASLGLPATLEPDKRESCAIQVDKGLRLYLELSPTQDEVVIGCQLGEVPPGPYGTKLLQEALKANGAMTPHSGVLAYSTHAQQLVLFDKVPLADAQADELVSAVQKMLPRARQWHDAIASGQLPPPPQSAGPTAGSGMFGLQR